jgi:hypothetical protein
MTPIINNPSAPSLPDPKRLTATEQKLLQQIQSHVQPRRSLIRFLSNSVCGFFY